MATVDAERLASVYLRDQAELQALIAQRVYTAMPDTKTFPLVVITQIGGQPVFSRPLHLDRSRLQFDVYGGTKLQAREVMDTVRTLLAVMPGAHDLGVVTGVDFFELVYLPDDSFDNPRPRYVFDVEVYSYPHPDDGLS